MEFSTELVNQLVGDFAAKVVSEVKMHPTVTLAEIESELRQMLQRVGAQALGAALTGLEQRYPAGSIRCACGGQAAYMYRREAKIVSLFGRVSYRRAYYVCSVCHQGCCPLDIHYGIEPGQISAALATQLALLGVQTSFEEASVLAARLLLVDVSENSIRKETQQFGELQMGMEARHVAQSQELAWLTQRTQTHEAHPTRLYGSLDGTIIPLLDGWRELKAGCWYEVERLPPTPTPLRVGELPALRAKHMRYYADIADADRFSQLVWATGVANQADVADELVFVADGATWIWNLVEQNFPQAVQIVDWYHAVSYLPPVAEAAFGKHPLQAQAWLTQVETDLWEGRIHQVRAACQALLDQGVATELAAKALSYFTHHAHRMDYARFRRNGYQIGSGTMESACKQIATLRLKRPGAAWSEDGARKTAKARAAWLSHQWDPLATQRARPRLAA